MKLDVELERVAAHLRSLPLAHERIARVLRSTYDQIYDGANTGRYRWDQLHKTEKTHFGSLVEINLQREFGFPGGAILDFSIAGTEVDCKFSQDSYAWMFPVEAIGHVCLVITANDSTARWSAGLLRVDADLLGKPNRDMKRRLTSEGRDTVMWLWRDLPFPPNVLLQVPRAVADAILAPSSGQQRINQLFRLVQGQIVPRGTVATVARQRDYMKRVRYNGGARDQLRNEGIVIFGDYCQHARIANKLGLPVPSEGEFVSARLAPATPGSGVEIDGGWWRLATDEDPLTTAPRLPRQ